MDNKSNATTELPIIQSSLLFEKVKRHLEYRGYLKSNQNPKAKLLNQFISIITDKEPFSGKLEQLVEFIKEHFKKVTFKDADDPLNKLWIDMEFFVLLMRQDNNNLIKCLELIRKNNSTHLAIHLINPPFNYWIDLEREILQNVPLIISHLLQQMHVEGSELEQELKSCISKLQMNYSSIREMMRNGTAVLVYRKNDLECFVDDDEKGIDTNDDDDSSHSYSPIPDHLSIEIICETFTLERDEAVALLERYGNCLSNVLTAIYG